MKIGFFYVEDFLPRVLCFMYLLMFIVQNIVVIFAMGVNSKRVFLKNSSNLPLALSL